jgi:DNA-binding NarL/FixJ family response regulator
VATVRVVIADDHDEVRQSIRQLLERTDGFAVVGEAVDGAQAVAEAGRLLPDLVIMDVFMPEMGGLEATRQVVKKWPLVKVVALTADPRMVMDALAAGATGCLLKGDPAPALVAVLRNVVSGARSGPESCLDGVEALVGSDVEPSGHEDDDGEADGSERGQPRQDAGRPRLIRAPWPQSCRTPPLTYRR